MAESPHSEEVPITLPSKLQENLMTDCSMVTQKGKVVGVPVTHCVEKILKDYFTYCSQNLNEDISLILLAEVLDGLKIYFDFMLKDHLLYAEEKAQYECLIVSHDSHVTNSLDINGENQDIKCRTSPSTVYGYIHLLRLFVKLPLFLSKAQFPLSHIHILHQYFNGFLAYLETKADELFSKEQYSDRQ